MLVNRCIQAATSQKRTGATTTVESDNVIAVQTHVQVLGLTSDLCVQQLTGTRLRADSRCGDA